MQPGKVWDGIKARCFNPNSQSYGIYGGRGIRLCKEWESPARFIEWAMNNGWRKGLQIDRIDCDGNYEPKNCRFVTASENHCLTRFVILCATSDGNWSHCSGTQSSGFNGICFHGFVVSHHFHAGCSVSGFVCLSPIVLEHRLSD